MKYKKEYGMDIILNWMKEFMIIYLILTILTQLCASAPLKKYLRFFSGVILLLVMFSPILHLFGKDGKLSEQVSYETFLEQLDNIQQDSKKLEFIQNDNTVHRYEEAVARDIMRQAKGQQMPVSKVQVTLNGQYEIEKVSVWLSVSISKEDSRDAKKKLTELLQDMYGLKEEQLKIS